MTSSATREHLQQEIAIWYADGIIEQPTYDLLKQRYEDHSLGLAGVVKYLGIVGGFFAFCGFLGLVGAMTESALIGAIMLASVGIWLLSQGLKLADDVQQRYATSSKFVVTLGLGLWLAAVATVCGAVLQLSYATSSFITGLLVLPLAFYLAYQRKNIYLLILALLLLFHWVGSWSSMWGRSSYVFSVQDPLLMSVVALLVLAIGIYHEAHWYPATGRFYQAWQALGLLYLNMSLLILSIWPRSYDETHSNNLPWVLLLTAATLAQMVAGARWHSGLLRGFGVTFFCIDIYTRFHEHFWDQLQLGSYLLVGGLLQLALGGILEFFLRQPQQERAS